MAFMAIIRGLGLLFYILLGSREGQGTPLRDPAAWRGCGTDFSSRLLLGLIVHVTVRATMALAVYSYICSYCYSSP